MKLIILDRDGVINHESSDKVVTSCKDFIPIDSSLRAISRLKRAGYIVCVATNQAIISRKLASINDVAQIHAYLQKLLLNKYNVTIDHFFICPHASESKCSCRKPGIGMLLQIAHRVGLVQSDRFKVPFVGDAITDLWAAKTFGVIPVLVKTGKGIITLNDHRINFVNNLVVSEDLACFVEYWLERDNLITS